MKIVHFADAHIDMVSQGRRDPASGLPIRVLDFLKALDAIVDLPWITRSGMMSAQEFTGEETAGLYREMETRIDQLVDLLVQEARTDLPLVLAAHASVQGAIYGGERSVMLGNDLVLPGSLMRNPRFSYVALGHIHKAQDLNAGHQPPVVYPGSIERVDFGEVADEKRFVIAHLTRGEDTRVEWRSLPGRRFIDRSVRVERAKELMPACCSALPAAEEMRDAIVRLSVTYPRELEPMLDEAELRRQAEPAFEFHFLRRPQMENRVRLASDQTISSLTPLELLDLFWRSKNIAADESDQLQKLAADLLNAASQPATD